MRKISAFIAIFLLIAQFSNAQQNQWTSAELHHQIKKLNFLGSALYVAAHPDDENQRIISYLDNHVKARTAYLSMTRGDGGQNLIGPELREQLGVLRTQELLAARSVDGGEQLFTRANDFGYSKNPEETLSIWDKDAVLSDVVWTIRTFKPDIIINRFDHSGTRRNHGHHTASAMLSNEAFDITNNPNVYPEQLKSTQTWQPKRIFLNTSWWFYGSRENFEKADKSNFTTVDVGVYYPELGLSNNEIAAIARSQHKCQGFGQLTTRGSNEEYLELIKGESLNGSSNLFEGINTSWSRVKGGEAIGKLLEGVEANFNFSNPSTHLPDLVKAYALLQQIEDDHWKKLKSHHLKEIILAASGIYLEANAPTASATPGEAITLTVEALNRSNASVVINSITIANDLASLAPSKKLEYNAKENFQLEITIPGNMDFTSPYWLTETGGLGMYKVEDQKLIGKPETPTALMAEFQMNISGQVINYNIPVYRRFSRPDKGEMFEPFVVLPEVTAGFEDAVFIFSTAEPKQIPVDVKSGKDKVSGAISLQAPEGWSVSPKEIPFDIAKKNALQTVYFTVTPSATQSEGQLAAKITSEGKVFDQELVEIDYDHIPKQSLLMPASTKVVRLNIKKNGNSIGYIVGAGDKVPESLEQIGYNVEMIDVETMQASDLEKYDGIVTGIRAYNVIDALKFKQNILFDYVKNGGNLIVQYNTAGRWAAQFENLAPYPIKVSRDRVTDENSAVEIIAPNHDIIQTPNKITLADFDGWVQERGLYFPNEWGEEFTPILSMNDKGESPTKGSLLVAPYGKGHYIYTGLSFFRELPVGVPGAYKLFANMLSLSNNDSLKNTSDNVKGK